MTPRSPRRRATPEEIAQREHAILERLARGPATRAELSAVLEARTGLQGRRLQFALSNQLTKLRWDQSFARRIYRDGARWRLSLSDVRACPTPVPAPPYERRQRTEVIGGVEFEVVWP